MTRRHGAAMARKIERFAGVDEVFDVGIDVVETRAP